MSRLRRTGIRVAVLILLAALVPLSQPYRHERAWRVPPEHASYVDRALTGAAAAHGTSREDYRSITRPRVDEDQGQICVTLATHLSGDGGYRGCFDSQTGAFISGGAMGYSFRGERLWDRFGPWLW
jgi:hypothetical protein